MNDDRVLQRIVSAPDHEGRCVELVLRRAGGVYEWAARIDAWTSVVASGWHDVASLRSLADLAPEPRGDAVALARDVVIRAEGEDVAVIVIAADGTTAEARDDVRGLAYAAAALLDRAARESQG